MSNQAFHLPRFLRYAKTDYREKKRAYFWFFFITVMIYFLVLLMILLGEPDELYDWEFRTFLYYSGLFITGPIFAMRYFASLGRTGSALMTLMQPVAIFEKWLLAVLMTFVFYPLIYTLLFNVMTIPASWLGVLFENAERITNNIDPIIWEWFLYIPLHLFEPKYYLYEGNFYGKEIPIIAHQQIALWLIYYGLCASALTSCIMFKRLPMIKSMALGFGIFMFILLFMVSASSNDMNTITKYWWGDYELVNDFFALFINILIWTVAPTLMFVASFFALKERDLV